MAFERGEVQVERGASATSLQAIVRGGPLAGTNVPAENGEARAAREAHAVEHQLGAVRELEREPVPPGGARGQRAGPPLVVEPGGAREGAAARRRGSACPAAARRVIET